MTLRAIQEFFVHVESFRNIDLWYQGAYLLKLQIYTQIGDKQKERIYAHPFAHTRQYQNVEEEKILNDPQIIKDAFIHNQTSSFATKSFLLRYYEQQVQINDMVHFRVETEISLEQKQFILQASLMFYDQQIKKIDPSQITLDKGKNPKIQRYILKNSKRGIHEYIPIVYDGQYFSLANISIHSVCLDYRIRACKLQLYEFSRMSGLQKKRILQKNKKIQPFQPNINISNLQNELKGSSINFYDVINEILLKGMQKNYQNLFKQYRIVYSRSITQVHKQIYSHILVHPNQLPPLFQIDQNQLCKRGQRQMTFKPNLVNNGDIIERFLEYTNLISGQIIKLWHHFIDIIKVNPRFTIAHYENIFRQSQQQLWSRLSNVQQIDCEDICIAQQNLSEVTQKIEKQLLLKKNELQIQGNVICEQLLLKKRNLSLMIQDKYRYQRQQNKMIKLQQQDKISLHLVILVHGFQGNSLDMKLLKNNFSLYYPEVSFLCASSNQELTDTDIIQMGHRLATQVRNHINQFFPPQSLQHISFIGHSLGGVIIRAALPRLLDFKNKFHTFISFSSPHIGYKVNTSSVIEAGIWVLQKFKNSNCLKQLTMSDNINPKETCLYKISKFEGMKYFKNIFLFSSRQDSYAPYQSARIQIHPEFMNAKDPLKQIHCEMVKNILEGVRNDVLHRIRVNFLIEQTNLDSIIGRTAHILFLQDSQLIQMFLHTHPQILS